MSAQEQRLLHLLSTGVPKRDEGTFKFYNRGIWETPQDFTVKIEKPRQTHLLDYDRKLRRFQYAEALAKALKLFDTSVILTVVEDLIVR